MGITVRLWSDEELKKIATGQDKYLTTIFMNVKTFNEKMIKAYPYHLRKTYLISFHDQDEVITVYATDDENLIKFLKAEYHFDQIEDIREQITKYRDISFKKHLR